MLENSPIYIRKFKYVRSMLSIHSDMGLSHFGGLKERCDEIGDSTKVIPLSKYILKH